MSNPIASETGHGTVLHEGHYGPVHCHCSECDYLVDSAEAQLQSDPSGKGAERQQGFALAEEYIARSLGISCRDEKWFVGFEDKADGFNSVVEACSALNEDYGAAQVAKEKAESDAASLRQQLEQLDAEVSMLRRQGRTHSDQKWINITADLRQQLTEAQGGPGGPGEG